MIEIYKNFLSNSELAFVNNTLCGCHWGFGYVSTDRNKPIWNFDKEKGRPAAELIFSKFEGYELDSWYINGQTTLLDGSPHTDNHANCTHSFILFPMKWNYTWGGRLNIMGNNPQVITPEENLGVLFDASILHYAEGPVVPQLRISIALKMKLLTKTT